MTIDSVVDTRPNRSRTCPFTKIARSYGAEETKAERSPVRMHGLTSRPNDPGLSGPFDLDRMAEIRIRTSTRV